MSLIRDSYDKIPSPSDTESDAAGLSTCPDCGAKVDSVALKKRMAADQQDYKGKEKEWSFWDSMSQANPGDKELRRKSDDARGAAFRTANRWVARRDSLEVERAKPKGRK